MPVRGFHIDRQLAAIGSTITNIRANSQLREALEEIGITAAQIDQGEALLRAAQAAQSATYARASTLTQGSQRRNEQRQRLHKHLRTDIVTVRLAFAKRPDLLSCLGITGQIPRGLKTLYVAERFYEQFGLLSPEEQGLAESEGLNAERRAQAASLISETHALNATYLSHKAERQNATEQRNQTLESANRWHVALIRRARLALADQPQLLEALGVIV